MDVVFEDLNQITPNWLADLLRLVGVLHQGSVRQVDKIAGLPAESTVLHLNISCWADKRRY